MLLVMIAHLFTVMLRQSFTSVASQPILTMPMGKSMIGASLTKSLDFIKQALKFIEYYLKRNAEAYQSHRNTRLAGMSCQLIV
jgi:hypothetical protein